VIILPFLAGSYLNHRITNLDQVAKRMIAFNLVFLEPPIILWSILGLSLSSEMVLLPVSGAGLAIAGFMMGKFVARGIQLKEKSAKVYTICSSLANQGFTMGGFLCYLLAGERGLALSGIFLIYYVPYTFLFIFAYAGMEQRRQVIYWSSVKGFLFNTRNMPLLAVLAAVVIRLFGIERPAVHFPLELFLLVAIALYYFTLGINFRISDLNPLHKEHLLLAVQKFILLPILAFAVIHFLPIADELKLIIKIESLMPVAIYAVISSIIFNLDSRKATSMFVINSLIFIFLVFPLLFFTRWILYRSP
jgi:hypothetical protein